VHRLQFYPGVVAQQFHFEFEVARQVFRAFEPVYHQRDLRTVVSRERHAQQAGGLMGFQQRLEVSHRDCSLVESGTFEFEMREVAICASELAANFLTVVIRLRTTNDKPQVFVRLLRSLARDTVKTRRT